MRMAAPAPKPATISAPRRVLAEFFLLSLAEEAAAEEPAEEPEEPEEPVAEAEAESEPEVAEMATEVWDSLAEHW